MVNTTYLCILVSVFYLDVTRSVKIRNNFKYITDQMSKKAASRKGSNIETKWMEQPLDHFDINDNRKFKIKYYEDRSFWQDNGPIYLIIGGEASEISGSNDLDNFLLYQLATETNGLAIKSQHRYYDDSAPPLNLTGTKNLKYLSSRQALADLAHLIKSIKSSSEFNASNSKVVVTGSSYAGNLAAWMKLLYPDLVDGAVASSAPVLAKKDFFEFYEKNGENFRLYGGFDCYQTIQRKFNRWDQLFKTSEGIKQLKLEENICENSDMTIPEHKAMFFDDKRSLIWGYGINAIRGICSDIRNDSPSLGIKESLKVTSNGCHNYSFPQYIEFLKHSIDINRFFWYQKCTEFGYFQTTDSNNQPFSNVPLDYFLKVCYEVFGPEFDEHRVDTGIAYTNQLYGGLHPDVKNVVFVNGELDPWSTLSILKDLSEDAPARVIKEAFHGWDMGVFSNSDSPELIKVKKFVVYMVMKWLDLLK